jgi:hypothetical protein
MDIHKPKPIRNWREFLKEVGIIVLGVCIALAAEQAVEWWHWRNEVSAARAALRTEIAAFDDFYIYRIAIGPCVDRRINTLERQIAEVAKNHKTGPVDISVRGIGALINDSEWQSEKSAQTPTHFPRAELALMGKIYAQAPDTREWETKQADALWSLKSLQGAEVLAAPDLAQMRFNLQIARHYEFLIQLTARRTLALGDQLGIARVAADATRVEKFCTLSDADYARYLQTVEPR